VYALETVSSRATIALSVSPPYTDITLAWRLWREGEAGPLAGGGEFVESELSGHATVEANKRGATSATEGAVGAAVECEGERIGRGRCRGGGGEDDPRRSMGRFTPGVATAAVTFPAVAAAVATAALDECRAPIGVTLCPETTEATVPVRCAPAAEDAGA
jgi:hypothetical protein